METLRLLRPDDLPQALELSTAAGWNQTPEDWARMMALEPRGCFGMECDGRVVATTTLLCYGTELAWVGMVLTHAEYRRRGLARELMIAAMDRARSEGVRSLKLDATDLGEPLYRSLGFEPEQPVERWRREPGPVEGVVAAVSSGTVPVDLDCEAFGTDRMRFLTTLGDTVQRTDDGYATGRAGIRARYFGPGVTRSRGSAERLARAMVGAHPEEPWFWDVLPQNEDARAIAVALGFRPVRRLQRMRYGGDVPRDDSLVLAIAGFEAG